MDCSILGGVDVEVVVMMLMDWCRSASPPAVTCGEGGPGWVMSWQNMGLFWFNSPRSTAIVLESFNEDIASFKYGWEKARINLLKIF